MVKRDMKDNKLFTTGQVAKICGVHLTTVQKWVDGNLIASFYMPRIDGQKGDRRISRNSLIEFMDKYGLPVDELFGEEEEMEGEDEECTT